jgi:hypothetical protein
VSAVGNHDWWDRPLIILLHDAPPKGFLKSLQSARYQYYNKFEMQQGCGLPKHSNRYSNSVPMQKYEPDSFPGGRINWVPSLVVKRTGFIPKW